MSVEQVVEKIFYESKEEDLDEVLKVRERLKRGLSSALKEKLTKSSFCLLAPIF